MHKQNLPPADSYFRTTETVCYQITDIEKRSTQTIKEILNSSGVILITVFIISKREDALICTLHHIAAG